MHSNANSPPVRNAHLPLNALLLPHPPYSIYSGVGGGLEGDARRRPLSPHRPHNTPLSPAYPSSTPRSQTNPTSFYTATVPSPPASWPLYYVHFSGLHLPYVHIAPCHRTFYSQRHATRHPLLCTSSLRHFCPHFIYTLLLLPYLPLHC
ncbi:hypothetical protein CesoFtcFv8_013420 [Champsocephalus esox]|uniref:Uncharacterized protein n=1 Tax=Champsocephalus esox TaxID=159716 RepID=A0AAN8BQV3_9TELE|nr:hypothetical protein CesoFtcFv8_013420 [Champsocephalus esox]